MISSVASRMASLVLAFSVSFLGAVFMCLAALLVLGAAKGRIIAVDRPFGGDLGSCPNYTSAARWASFWSRATTRITVEESRHDRPGAVAGHRGYQAPQGPLFLLPGSQG